MTVPRCDAREGGHPSSIKYIYRFYGCTTSWTWSVQVEMSFYALSPLLVAPVQSRHGSRATMRLYLLILCSLILRMIILSKSTFLGDHWVRAAVAVASACTQSSRAPRAAISVSCIAGGKHFHAARRRMTVGPVGGGKRRQSESAGLGERFGGGLQPQLAQIRPFCVRVKILSLNPLFKSTCG